MSCKTPRHCEVDETGRGKCSVPMWWGWGGDAGFCDEEAYGPQVPSQKVSGEFGPGWENGRWYPGGVWRPTYASGLACPKHGGPTSRVYKDGDSYCAVLPDFVNLQESPAGFGESPEEARQALKEYEQ